MAKRMWTAACLAAAIAAGIPAGAEDWPRFRGSGADGISEETGLLDRWPDGGPEVVWRTALGEGYSGLSVAEGRVYTLYSRDRDEFAVCLSAADGKEIWKVRVDDAYSNGQGNGPRSTPTVDGEMVYVLTGRGKLYALSARGGSVHWKRDLVAEMGAKVPRWGMSGSPVVEGRLLLIEVGSPDALMAAFNRKTGETVWTSGGGKAGYSTPLAVTIGGTRQAVFFTAETIYGVAVDDGRILWSVPWKTSYDVNAAMPVFLPPDRLFISSGYDTGAAMFRIESRDGSFRAKEIWRNREMKNQFSTSVVHDGYIYGFDNKILKCLDAATGEMKWRARDLGHGSLFYADGHLIVLGERGRLVLVDASPEAYREKGGMQVFDGKTWTVPTLSGGTLYVRDENELVALNVGAEG